MNFLPQRQRQDDIRFIFAKSLPYMIRIKIVIICIFLGILIQLFLNFWIGLVIIACGVCLGLIQGYTAKPDLKGQEEWNQVTPDEYRKVKDKQNQLRKWDIDAFDITNKLGGTVFVVIGVCCWGIWFLLNLKGQPTLAFNFALDSAVLLLPHWITGVRTYLTKDKLIIKIGILERVMDALASPSDIQVLPMLSTQEASGGGRVPADARLMVRFLNAPKDFLGMQVQISITNVQGKDFPYLYCVLIAKQEASFFKGKSKNITGPNIICELTHSQDVDVLVIRQQTTKTSGYHTSLSAALRIVNTSLTLARSLIKQ